MNDTTSPGRPEDELIPEGAPLQAFLYSLRKAHREIEGLEEAHGRFGQVKTRRHAREYIEELLPKFLDRRHEQHRR